MRADRGALVIAACTGASAWISIGALAVTSERLSRVGALPPLWALPALVVVAVAAAAAIRLRTSDSWPLTLAALLWLPWLPVSVPAPLLIWEGPLEVAIWMCALGGTAISAARVSSWPVWRGLVDSRPAAVAVTLVALGLSLAAAVSLRERIPGGDEPHYLIITQSLLNDGDLRIEDNHDRGEYFAYHADALSPDFLQRGRDGAIYSVHAPGVSALLVPAFWLAGYPGSVVFVAGLAALGLAAGWLSTRQLVGAPAAAWVGVAAVGLSATHFFHSFVIFPDPVGGAIVGVALALVIAFECMPHRVRAEHVAAVGLLLGGLPWLHTRFALLAGAFGVVIALRCWHHVGRWRLLAAFGAAPLVLAVGWFAYFWIIYGTLDPSVAYGSSPQNDLAWMPRGILGLLFDQQFGVVANAPALVVTPVGWYWLWRRHRRLAVEWVAIVVPYVLVVASFSMWWGGWSAPGRFLVAVLPLLVPLLALAFRESGAAARDLFVALILVGAANVAARVVALDGQLLYNVRDGSDLLLDWLSGSVNLPLALPALHRAGGEALALRLATLWLAAGLLAWLVLFLTERWRGVGGRWARAAAAIVAAASLALAAAWSAAARSPLSVETSELVFLQRWRDDLRPLHVDVSSLERRTTPAVLQMLELRTPTRVRAADPNVLLRVPWVPAGEYQVLVEGARELSGHLRVHVGMTSQTMDVWPLEGRLSGDTGLFLSLPALAHSVTIEADAEAAARIRRLTLRPRIAPTARRSDEYVIRAARFADVRAYLLDDEVFLEPDGLWTRGDSRARLVLAGDRPTSEVDFQAGPVDTVVDLQTADWRGRVELAAGQRRRVVVPVSGDLAITTRGTFRPVDYDPQSRDERRLGVRVEFP